jgi:hypothetical protein
MSSQVTAVIGAAGDATDAPASKRTGVKSEAEEPAHGFVTREGALSTGEGDGQLMHSATAPDAPANGLCKGSGSM